MKILIFNKRHISSKYFNRISIAYQRNTYILTRKKKKYLKFNFLRTIHIQHFFPITIRKKNRIRSNCSNHHIYDVINKLFQSTIKHDNNRRQKEHKKLRIKSTLIYSLFEKYSRKKKHGKDYCT